MRIEHPILCSLLLVSIPTIAQQGPEKDGPSSETPHAPVDLNATSLKRIARRTTIGRIRCIRLLEYRREHGPIRSYYELYYLKGFTASIVQKVRANSFITEHEKPDTISLKALENINGRFRLRWGRILQQRKGFRRGTYRGPPSLLKGQLRITIPGIAGLGIKLEKDAGEPWLSPKNKLPESIGGYLRVAEQGILEKAVIGSMRSSSGGGVLLDNGGGFPGARGPAEGPLFTLDPHTGSPDRKGLQGIGGKFRKGAFRGAILLSSERWTARLDTSRKGTPRLRTLYRNGVHRRPALNRKKERWHRKELITHLGWKSHRHAISTSFHYAKASHPKAPSGRIRDRYADLKAEQKGAELHYRGSIGRKRWALTMAMEGDRSKAFAAAFSTRPNNDLWLRSRIEGSGKGFDPFWSSLARNGRPFIRVSLGADRKVAPGLRIDLEHQLLHRPWPYYGRKGAGTDRQLSLTTVRTGEDQQRVEAEISYEVREKDADDEQLRDRSMQKVPSLQFSAESEIPLSADLQSRIKVNAERLMQEGIPDGLLFAHDLVRSWKEKEFKLYWRIAFFDAPSYATRPYAYENDLLYAFSVRSYYRSGLRSYILVRVGLSKNLTLEGKMGGWAYRDVEGGNIGNGDRAIPGRYRSRIRLQLRGSF